MGKYDDRAKDGEELAGSGKDGAGERTEVSHGEEDEVLCGNYILFVNLKAGSQFNALHNSQVDGFSHTFC